MASNVRVRIAPSPTGSLHVGTARTALYNYLYARHTNGAFVLRLEDTDEVRSDEAHTKDILDGLHWLGLTWDEGPDVGGPFPPYRQTQKVEHYEKVARKLVESGHAYFCFCSAEELDALREEQKLAGAATRYDNRCRNITQEQIEKLQAAGRVPTIRFKIEEPRIVTWNDAIKGTIAIDSSDMGGDMVIVKSTGMAIYNFAVVVDDVDMKMTHVIRGEDHIHNTAKQLLIYEALGEQPPEFAHAALIFDTDRRKLSKRHHGELVHVDRYRKDGYMPEAIINYLAQMSWQPTDGREIFSLEDAAQMFELERISKSPAVFDVTRLNWFNSSYIRSLPLPLVTERALPYFESFNIAQYTREELEHIVGAVRDGLTMLKDITSAAAFFFETTVAIPDDVNTAVLQTENAKKILEGILAKIGDFPWGDAKGCKSVVDVVGKEIGLKGKDLYFPIRAALQGKTSGPDLGVTISILGKDRLKSRIESALGLCRQT